MIRRSGITFSSSFTLIRSGVEVAPINFATKLGNGLLGSAAPFETAFPDGIQQPQQSRRTPL